MRDRARTERGLNLETKPRPKEAGGAVLVWEVLDWGREHNEGVEIASGKREVW